MITTNLSQKELLEFLKLQESDSTLALESVNAANSRYFRDLKLNIKGTLQSTYLSEKETALLALAIAANEHSSLLLRSFRNHSQEAGAPPEEIAEAIACTSILSANNVLYRFRHFMQNDKYQQLPARLRMNVMSNPVMGKEFFELISLAVSAVNGCETCVRAHESSLRALGCSHERIFDAIRLASVVVSLGKII